MAIQTNQQFRMCDVHRLLDYDCESRYCFYCSMCDAWICQDDTNRWDRRLRAALKRKQEPEYRGIPDYENKYKGELNGVIGNTIA